MIATKSYALTAIGLLLALGLAALTLNSQADGNLSLPRIVPTVAPGLSREHHSELNGMNIPATRYDELRAEYKGNSAAQQEIDAYDPTTEYHVQLEKFLEAFKANDEEKIAELEKWFKEHYPDV